MPSFVHAKGSEQAETATLLLALADEKKIDRSLIRIVHDGFEVPDELLTEVDRDVIEPKHDEPAPAPKRRGRPPKAKVEEAPVEEDEAPEDKTENED